MAGTIRGKADEILKSLERNAKAKFLQGTVNSMRAVHRSLPGTGRVTWTIPVTFVRPGARVEIKGDTVTMEFGQRCVIKEFPRFGDRTQSLEQILRNLNWAQIFGLTYVDMAMMRSRDALEEHGTIWTLLFAAPDPSVKELADFALVQVLGQAADGSNLWEFGATVSYHSKGQVLMQVFNDGELFESGDPSLSPETRRLTFEILTGDDDLRGGTDNLDVIVSYSTGTAETYYNINASARWADRTVSRPSISLYNPVRIGYINAIMLRTTSRGGAFGDNWNLQSLSIQAETSIGSAPIYSAQRKDGSESGCLFRFTGQKREFFIKLPQ